MFLDWVQDEVNCFTLLSFLTLAAKVQCKETDCSSLYSSLSLLKYGINSIHFTKKLYGRSQRRKTDRSKYILHDIDMQAHGTSHEDECLL